MEISISNFIKAVKCEINGSFNQLLDLALVLVGVGSQLFDRGARSVLDNQESGFIQAHSEFRQSIKHERK